MIRAGIAVAGNLAGDEPGEVLPQLGHREAEAAQRAAADAQRAAADAQRAASSARTDTAQAQREAALAVGMTPLMAIRYVILPQAWRIVLPPLPAASAAACRAPSNG